MNPRTILISGASIAGPALAYWLARHGFHTTVVERARALRTGGQNVDVHGTAREVARRMGIEDAIRAATTGEKGVRFVDDHDAIRAELPAGKSDTGGFTKELEVLRGDLARILHERTRDGTEYVFGDRITALREEGDRVTVTFERGHERDFDLVIAADGIRSQTRSLILGDEPKIRFLGQYLCWFTSPDCPPEVEIGDLAPPQGPSTRIQPAGALAREQVRLPGDEDRAPGGRARSRGVSHAKGAPGGCLLTAGRWRRTALAGRVGAAL